MLFYGLAGDVWLSPRRPPQATRRSRVFFQTLRGGAQTPVARARLRFLWPRSPPILEPTCFSLYSSLIKARSRRRVSARGGGPLVPPLSTPEAVRGGRGGARPGPRLRVRWAGAPRRPCSLLPAGGRLCAGGLASSAPYCPQERTGPPHASPAAWLPENSRRGGRGGRLAQPRTRGRRVLDAGPAFPPSLSALLRSTSSQIT